jgi:hypothetical protein
MKKILLVLIFLPIILFGQPKPPSNPSSNELFGTTQNNIMGVQAKSFGGGSIIKPNPMLTSADIAFIGSNTYEPNQPLFRLGAGLGYGKNNKNSGYGANAILTFDLSQQSYSTYFYKNNLYYHLNFGSMATTKNVGLSVTKVFKSKIVNTGVQIGTSILEDHKYVYFIMVPYAVLMVNKEIEISNRINWKPEAFITLCSPYYDLGMNFSSTSNTFNAVVGNNLSVDISKYFKLNVNYRTNINTTPKLGIMHNILIGGNLDF